MEVLYKITFVSILCLISIRYLKDKYPEMASLMINACFIVCLFMPIIINTPLQFTIISPVVDSNLNPDIKIRTNNALPENLVINNNSRKNTINTANIKPTNFITLASIWVVGIILIAMMRLYQLLQLLLLVYDKNNIRRKKLSCSNGGTKKANVLINKFTDVPFLFVSNHIYIVLPKKSLNWDDKHIDMIIKHELCHYQRKDHWSLWLSIFIHIVFWFHPILHILRKKQNELIELSCDKKLLNQNVNKHDYAKALLYSIRDNNQQSMTPHMSVALNQVHCRLKAILSPIHSPIKTIHKFFFVMFTSTSLLSGCIVVSDNFTHLVDGGITLVGYELPSLINNQLDKGQLLLSAFYDGKSQGNTFIAIEVRVENQLKWLKLGPLKKFNETIHTWHFSIKEGTELTGKYNVTGVVEDGTVDGVAIGMIYSNKDNKIVRKQSNEILEAQIPSLICSWPLDLHDDELLKVLPLNSEHKIDSVKRLLCGAQLVGDGDYYF